MRRPQLSLLAKVVLALAAVGLIPLAFATFRLSGLNKFVLETQILQTNIVAATTTATRVAEFVESRRTLVLTLTGNPTIDADPQSPDAVQALSGFLRARSDLGAVIVVDPAGETVIRLQRPGLSEEMTVVASTASAEAVAWVEGSEGRWLRLEEPLSEGRGSLLLIWDAAALADAVDPAVIGEEASLALVTPEGEVLAGSRIPLEEFPSQFLELARSGRVSGASSFDIPGAETVLAAYDSVAGTSWFILSKQPERIAAREAHRMRRGVYWALGLALLLAGGLSAAAYSSIVRPIRELNQAQRRFAGLADAPTGGGDEIAQLKTSFKTLERRVRERDEAVQVFLGRYQVLDPLGDGAMGMVFRGWDPKLDRPVAIKTIRLDKRIAESQRGELAERLVHEAVTAAKFNHPNIVSIFDVQDAPEGAFIAMELIDGVSLESHIWSHHHLDSDQVAVLGAAIADGLAAAHRHGVVHHDIKPANILLGVDGTIKVTDFGISQAISSLSNMTESVFGTPGYLPPETLKGKGYDPKGDLFSLGVVLYHALTGERPFEAGNLRQVLKNTLSKDVEPPKALREEIPEDLSQVVMDLLERDPANRPGDAGGVADRLRQIALRLGAVWNTDRIRGKERSEANDEIPRTRLLPTVDVDSAVAGDPTGGRA